MDKFLLDKTRAAAGYRDRLTFVRAIRRRCSGGVRRRGVGIESQGAGLAGAFAPARLPRRGDGGGDGGAAGRCLDGAQSRPRPDDERTERSQAVSFIEDGAVPVEHLADYISDVERIIYDHDTTYAIYAHASAGCLHIRPLINLKSLQGRQQYRAIADAVAETVMKYQGRLPASMVRAWCEANSANTFSAPNC